MADGKSLPALMRLRREESPDAIAIQHVDGRSLTNAEYADAAAGRARALLARGVAPGDNIATFVEDKIEAVINWPGVAWSGGLEVPINPQLTGDPLAHGVNDSQARFLVTTAKLLPEVAAVADRLTDLEAVLLLGGGDTDSDIGLPVLGMPTLDDVGSDAAGLRDPDLWDPSCIIYTSGTTGPPKGVVLPWGLHAISLTPRPENPRDCFGPRYSYTPQYHLSGKGSLYSAIAFGDTEVIRDSFSLSSFWSDQRKYGCTYVQLFPQLMTLLLGLPENPADADNPVEVMLSMPATPDIDEFKRRFGIRRVITGFGMTEIGAGLLQSDATSRKWDAAGTVPSGPPWIDVKLVDEHDYEVPAGEVGEFLIRHRDPWAINLGYYNRPEATLEAWRGGWFHTGDAMRQDEDGDYYFVDRLKDYIRRKGENISSFEVERFVVEHPAVLEVAAIGVAGHHGEDEVKIVVVAQEGHEPDPEDLHEYLCERMPRYMLPRYVDYVEALPKTPATGRIRKGELKKGYVSLASWDSEASRSSGIPSLAEPQRRSSS